MAKPVTKMNATFSDAVYEVTTVATAEGFSKAITVWINKPQVINRRLCGAKIIHHGVNNRDTDISSVCRRLSQQSEELPNCNAELDGLDVNITGIDNLYSIGDEEMAVICRDMLPKQPERYQTVREIITYDKSVNSATFTPLCHFKSEDGQPAQFSTTSEISYQLCLVERNDIKCIQLKLTASHTNAEETKANMSKEWLKTHLLAKIKSWSEQSELKTTITSLRLVPVDEYNILYNQLKTKHGYRLVENWTEKTDPQKFVFEDVAIATYLLLLWQMERKEKNVERKQTFVDLGCGNGLLVHLLSLEGHAGVGIDVRKRNIWDMYGPETVLKEMSITPSADSLFPDYDWIIGNHSDELTPWIPVMAARSSYQCSYFVLPCCHHDFHSKFDRRQSGTSQYRTYLDFVQQVGEVCGFKVQEDTLRIPSTKRVCYIGNSRTYPQSDETLIDAQRTDFINSRHSYHRQIKCPKLAPQKEIISENSYPAEESSGGNELEKETNGNACNCENDENPFTPAASNSWSSHFQPREKVEKTRNCRNIEKDVKNHIIQTVFDNLLKADEKNVLEISDGRSWRKGGTLPLGDVVSLFDREILLKMKSECGGLQTLLRNYNSIFQVSGGMVQLRDLTLADPWGSRSKMRKTDKKDYFKTVPCWFHENHPDGCPRTAQTCTFAHGEAEIRQRPQKLK